jgi:hypothetical protein
VDAETPTEDIPEKLHRTYHYFREEYNDLDIAYDREIMDRLMEGGELYSPNWRWSKKNLSQLKKIRSRRTFG